MKEEYTERTYYCDSCEKEFGLGNRPTNGGHGHITVDPIHTMWGSRTSFNLHFCEQCAPEKPLTDKWNTIEKVVFNSKGGGAMTEPCVTVVKVKWTAGQYGGEALTDVAHRVSDGGPIQEYIQTIEQACQERYDFDHDGPTESGW